MSIVFDAALPPNDTVLAETIGTAEIVELRRDNLMLLEVVRVLRAAPGIKELKITGLSMLRASETDTVVYGQAGDLSYQTDPKRPKHDLWDLERLRACAPAPALERLDISGNFQPECRKQMEWLVKALLQGSSKLKALKLNIFEYATDQLVAQLKRDVPLPTSSSLPSILGMEPKPTEEERQLAIEGRQIGEMMVASILGHMPLRIENAPTDLETALDALMAAAETSLPAETCTTLALKPETPSVISLLPARPLLKNMTHAQYDDLMQTLYTAQLSEAMESLSLRVILRGSQVQSTFLFLPQLTTLDLQFCDMDDEAFAVIGPTISRRMPSLTTLRLARNRLVDAELGELIGPALETLDCSSNPITSRSAGHLFRAMAFNDRLHEVDLSFTHIDPTLSFVGLNHWTASPALLRIPNCLSDEDVVQASMYVHEGVELELVSEAVFGGREAGLSLMQ